MVGYPFDLYVTATYSLADDGMHLTVSAYNNGDTNAPWALAIHPWLANSLNGYGDEIDEHNAKCSLTLPARTHVTVDKNLIPTGTEPVDGTKYDLREDTLLTEQPFDDAWTDLEHAEDGSVTAVFTRADGKKVRVGGDETITSFQVSHRYQVPRIPASCRRCRGATDRLRQRVQHRQRADRDQAGRNHQHLAVPRYGRVNMRVSVIE